MHSCAELKPYQSAVDASDIPAVIMYEPAALFKNNPNLPKDW